MAAAYIYINMGEKHGHSNDQNDSTQVNNKRTSIHLAESINLNGTMKQFKNGAWQHNTKQHSHQQV